MTIENIQDHVDEMDDERRSLFGRVAGATRRYVYAGVGVISVGLEKATEFRHETVEKRIDRLAERGQAVRERRLGSLGEATETTRGIAVGMTRQVADLTGSTLDGMAKAARERLNLASSTDIETVAQQLDELTTQIESIEGSAAV